MDSAPTAAGVSAVRARTLLRKLRDLNLLTGPLKVGGGRRVSVLGCLSLDAPVEDGLRYRIRSKEGTEHELGVAWSDGALLVTLSPPADGGPRSARRVPLLADPDGAASAPTIGARMDPESNHPREVEHFLRRLVLSAFDEGDLRAA